ncbi:SyrP protein [bacterium]|nr:SyrP protein [bacterium]
MTATTVVMTELHMTGQPEFDGQFFPAILNREGDETSLPDVLTWVRENRDSLDAKASQSGAILFRGLPLVTANDFDAFIRAFDYPNFRYEDSLSNAVRVNRTERVFTANEAPSSITICLHHEMAQTPVYPSRLFFFCEKPADAGGATPLCRSDWLFDRLCRELPQFARNCEEKGLLYTNVMPAENDPTSGMGRGWQSTFRSESRDTAEQRMRELGYSWEWLDDGCLRATTPRLQAVRELPDGRKTFFNQLIAAFHGWKDSRNDPAKAITFGDGTLLNPADVDRAAQIAEELTFDVPWQAGDVALVDNYVAMHGRRSFEGRRIVLASLVAS